MSKMDTEKKQLPSGRMIEQQYAKSPSNLCLERLAKRNMNKEP